MATSPPLPELILISPRAASKSLVSPFRYSLFRIPLFRSPRFNVSLRTKIKAVNEEDVIVEERESDLIKEVNGYGLGGNGAAYNGNGSYRYNGSVNGGVTVRESENGVSNGSLVKYVNGNGAAATVLGDIQVSESKEEVRQRRIEEVGREEAWFKRSDQQVEV